MKGSESNDSPEFPDSGNGGGGGGGGGGQGILLISTHIRAKHESSDHLYLVSNPPHDISHQNFSLILPMTCQAGHVGRKWRRLRLKQEERQKLKN